MKIKLNNGVTLKLFEPIAYMSNNAFYAYSNSDYKIAYRYSDGDEINKYYILLGNDAVCGPTNWEEVQEFFDDIYKSYFE